MDRSSPPSTEPWYAKGLRFRCTACGRCCGGSPGYVWVTDADVRRMAKHKGIPADEFERVYVRTVGDRKSLKEERDGDCVMLEGGKCSVYPVKPTPCSTFPFWDSVVASPEAWAETAARCPGMDHGDDYSRAEVETLASGVSAPLLEKQAAAREAAAGRGATEVPEETWRAALADLATVYAELDAELPRHEFLCVASGDCCDFDAYGHRLYATTLEAEWFFRNSPRQRANQDARQCPAWGADRLCKAREGRMLGCRTFFCAGRRGSDPNEVYERYYRRVKEVHERHGLPFRYADVVEWARERRPAAS
jgi:Fe-S-cluster containining protein